MGQTKVQKELTAAAKVKEAGTKQVTAEQAIANAQAEAQQDEAEMLHYEQESESIPMGGSGKTDVGKPTEGDAQMLVDQWNGINGINVPEEVKQARKEVAAAK